MFIIFFLSTFLFAQEYDFFEDTIRTKKAKSLNGIFDNIDRSKSSLKSFVTLVNSSDLLKKIYNAPKQVKPIAATHRLSLSNLGVVPTRNDKYDLSLSPFKDTKGNTYFYSIKVDSRNKVSAKLTNLSPIVFLEKEIPGYGKSFKTSPQIINFPVTLISGSLNNNEYHLHVFVMEEEKIRTNKIYGGENKEIEQPNTIALAKLLIDMKVNVIDERIKRLRAETETKNILEENLVTGELGIDWNLSSSNRDYSAEFLNKINRTLILDPSLVLVNSFKINDVSYHFYVSNMLEEKPTTNLKPLDQVTEFQRMMAVAGYEQDIDLTSNLYVHTFYLVPVDLKESRYCSFNIPFAPSGDFYDIRKSIFRQLESFTIYSDISDFTTISYSDYRNHIAKIEIRGFENGLLDSQGNLETKKTTVLYKNPNIISKRNKTPKLSNPQEIISPSGW